MKVLGSPYTGFVNIFKHPEVLRNVLNPTKPIAFLDANGVVVSDYSDNEGRFNLNFYSVKAIKYLKDKGYQIVMWTAANRTLVKDIKRYQELESMIDVFLSRENYFLKESKRSKILINLYDQSLIKTKEKNGGRDLVKYLENAKDFKAFYLLGLTQDCILIDDNNSVHVSLANYFNCNFHREVVTSICLDNSFRGSQNYVTIKPDCWIHDENYSLSDNIFSLDFIRKYV